MDRSLSAPNRSQLLARMLHALLFLIAGALSFSGWGISGTRVRNSYELVRSVRALELLDGTWATLAPVWFGLPVLVAAGLVAAGYGRNWLMVCLGVLVGALLIIGWWQVKVSPLRVDTGAAASAIVGTVLIAVSGASALFFGRASRR